MLGSIRVTTYSIAPRSVWKPLRFKTLLDPRLHDPRLFDLVSRGKTPFRTVVFIRLHENSCFRCECWILPSNTRAWQTSVLSVIARGSWEVVSYLQCAEICDGLRSLFIILPVMSHCCYGYPLKMGTLFPSGHHHHRLGGS